MKNNSSVTETDCAIMHQDGNDCIVCVNMRHYTCQTDFELNDQHW